jgi:hypothetical protein
MHEQQMVKKKLEVTLWFRKSRHGNVSLSTRESSNNNKIPSELDEIMQNCIKGLNCDDR